MKILVPVDGSKCSIRAVDHLIKKLGWFKGGAEIHLLNVQHQIPYGRRVTSVVGHDRITKYHQEEGLAALKTARRRLDAAKVNYQYHIGVGDEAEVICQYARDKGVDQIFMGTRGLGRVSTLMLGSVATKVIHLCPVPVLLVK